MSETFLEVLDALSDEDEQMAVLLEVIRLEERGEEIRKALKHTVDINTKAHLARELVEVESCIQNVDGRVQGFQKEAPILKLPYDVISDIAVAFSRVQENGAWLFSGVCRAWREAVLSTPRAWTNIHLRDEYSGPSHRTRIVRIPDPALCMERAGILPFHLELHELPTNTPNLPGFIALIMPHVQYLYIYESDGSEIRISQPAPRLKELLIMRSPRNTKISAEDFNDSSSFLVDLLGPTAPNQWVPILNRLQMARFHEINWKHKHLAAFKQLYGLTLSDCKCEAVGHLHELLRTNCKTLEHLHLSVYPSIMSELQEFQPILLPMLRKLSFLVGHARPTLYGDPIVHIDSHAISLFQSLIIPEVTELQVSAPCIQDLDLGTHCPSLQHLYFILPSTGGILSPFLQTFRSLLITAPLQTIDVFIASRARSDSYLMAMALGPFLRDPLVLEHPFLEAFTLTSDLDFEPLREGVRDEWTRADKWLHIGGATDQERRSNGFVILEDVGSQYSRRPYDLFIPYSDWILGD